MVLSGVHAARLSLSSRAARAGARPSRHRHLRWAAGCRHGAVHRRPRRTYAVSPLGRPRGPAGVGLDGPGRVTPPGRHLIRPASDWNVFDPQVIRWRLASAGRLAQLRSITELRTAVEPQAAGPGGRPGHATSRRATWSGSPRRCGRPEGGRRGALPRLDIEFHAAGAGVSGNEMFVKLHELVAEVLTGRTHYHLMPHYPRRRGAPAARRRGAGDPAGDGERARAAMVRIMEQAMRRDAVDVGARRRPVVRPAPA